ncbi:MAG: tetratricopeptide repeat protein [Sandaracinaceae bacterium]
MLSRAILAFALGFLAATTAQAQPRAQARPSDEGPRPGAPQLRADARAALAAGRIEEAYPLMQEAARTSDVATDWRELGEIADRLRLDQAALDAYETYLERAPEAPDRAAIEGRVRVLRHILGGGGYAIDDGGAGVSELLGWNGRRHHGVATDVLVDWQGRPQTRRTELLTLAEWDGNMRAPEPPIGTTLAPRGRSGLGRALSAP